MNSIAVLVDDKRRELFSESSAKKGISPAIVEKDFWVCWVLFRLFEHAELSCKILFKGGTSLSKVFYLIERFSEDSVPRFSFGLEASCQRLSLLLELSIVSLEFSEFMEIWNKE